jgi:hypothetical protein
MSSMIWSLSIALAAMLIGAIGEKIGDDASMGYSGFVGFHP